MIQVKKKKKKKKNIYIKNDKLSSTITSRGSGRGGSRKNKREGVVMGLLGDNFVLTHISLKCLFTKKWKIEREKDKEI
jgi:hypothetical protein